MSLLKISQSFILALCYLTLMESAVTQDRREEFRAQMMTEIMYQYDKLDLKDILSHHQVPERYLTGKELFYNEIKKSQSVLKFSWSNCGSAQDPVQVKSFSILPDPIAVPGDIQLNFDISTSVNVTEPLQVDMDIKKKVAFWWVSIPCIDNLGSCDYKDFCPNLPATCPPSFQEYKIPCNCPFQKGEYVMPKGTVTIPDISIPSWLTNGDYQLTLNAKNQAGDRLFCLLLQLTLKSS